MITIERAKSDNDMAVIRHAKAITALTLAVLNSATALSDIVRLAHEVAGSDNELRRTKQTLARTQYRTSTTRRDQSPDWRDAR